ncbi:MAG: hypothetical protein CTY12_01225 [Methylotenera sp.]|nr:MAG: hypothetical protein CTY12_01225 [Methylotenera sp.]
MEEQQPKMFKASWDSVEIQKWEAKINRELRKLKPYYKGKLRTVKQRNKARLMNLMVDLHNIKVLNHRESKRLEGMFVGIMANEIRKEIDQDILDSIINMLDPTLQNIEMERQQ